MAYITLEDLRAEGVTAVDYPNDEILIERITLAQEYIEKVTGRYFEVRSDTLYLNGTGHKLLYLPIPPKNGIDAITAVTINNETIDSEYYQYILRSIPDDRYNPRIIMLVGIWPKGTFNVTVTGSFGFVESDETTPLLIKELCKRITIWGIKPIADSSGSKVDNIIEEQIGDYRYKLSEAVKTGGVFRDYKIDNIISMFKKQKVFAV